MIKKLAPLLIVLFLACSDSKQPQESSVTDSSVVLADTTAKEAEIKETDPIALIRQRVEHINSVKLEKKHFEFMCDEKMLLDYFYEDGELVKISVDFSWIGDAHAIEEYYYDNGELIFNYEFVEGGPACEGCIVKNEYRSYIQNKQVIRYLKNQDQDSCRKCGFTAKSRQYELLKASTAEEMKAIMCR